MADLISSRRAILVKDGKSKTADGLYLGEAERPTLKQSEVLVKVRAALSNRAQRASSG